MPITVKDLLEAGCHFGHQTKRWNPKMKEFVYGAKNGISIIDLTKTIHQIGDACNFLQREVMNGSKVLFVGTKRQAQQIVKDTAETTGMYYMAERWMGGTLTNNETIRKSIKKMREYDAVLANPEASGLKKKELALMEKATLQKIIDTLNILVIPVAAVAGVWGFDISVYVAGGVAAVNGVLEYMKLFCKE